MVSRTASTSIVVLILCGLSAPARPEVVAAEAAGFVTRASVSIAAQPERVFARFLEVGRWWSDAHTFSGKAANMSMVAAPGGCWCETLESGGFIEHGRLTYLVPSRVLRFSSSLGPLHEAGGRGTMTVQFEAEAGAGTRVTVTYVALLFQPKDPAKGAVAIAPLFDRVLSQQLVGLKKSLE